MRALFIEHDHCSPTGLVGERFSQRGYDLTELIVVPAGSYAAPGVQARFPAPAAFDVIVVMGAIWSAYDDALIGSWLEPELDLLRAACEGGIPVLGICFGGQALARALGGTVTAASTAEIGWRRVTTQAPEVIEPGPWFEYHYDCWSPPAGARTLARTAAAPQAFTAGNSLGVQFHPEVTTAVLRCWLDNGAAPDLARAGISPAQLLAQTQRLASGAAARAHRLVDVFLDVIAPAVAAGPGAGQIPAAK